MTLQVLIDCKSTPLRTALIEDGNATEVHYISEKRRRGAIYRARVKKVDPAINAAFLDLGEGEAFLPFRKAKALKPDQKAGNISGLVTEGETILVQIMGEGSEEDKTPVASANPMVVGRYALTGHLPGKSILASSVPKEGKGLEEILKTLRDENALVIKEPAAFAKESLVKKDIRDLRAIWKRLEEQDGKPGLLLSPPAPMEKIFRDHVPGAVDEILVNDRIGFTKGRKLTNEKWPELREKITLYEDSLPLFEAFEVEERIDAAREGRVPLPSGGELIFERTAAMTVIDVNSGAARKGKGQGTLHLSTNLEAAETIARELRFQNICGLITVDFIDLKKKRDWNRVLHTLDQAFKNDKRKVERTGVNRFGILSLKRARRGEDLISILKGGSNGK